MVDRLRPVSPEVAAAAGLSGKGVQGRERIGFSTLGNSPQAGTFRTLLGEAPGVPSSASASSSDGMQGRPRAIAAGPGQDANRAGTEGDQVGPRNTHQRGASEPFISSGAARADAAAGGGAGRGGKLPTAREDSEGGGADNGRGSQGRNQSTEPARATPKQIESRIKGDADSLRSGAFIDTNNRLVVSRGELQALRREYVKTVATQTPEYTDFITHTPDGHLIDAYQRGTRNLVRAITVSLGERATYNLNDPAPGLSELSASPVSEGIDMGRLQRLSGHTEREGSRGEGDRRYAYDVRGQLADRIDDLQELSLVLQASPQYRLGSQVKVMRSDADGGNPYLEDGWTVNGISPNAQLEVAHPEGDSAYVGIDRLIAWNRPPEAK